MKKYVYWLIAITVILVPSIRAKSSLEIPFDEKKLVHGLEPAVVFKNAESHFTLQERMERYAVPGVSIAIVKDNKVIFAKGYGNSSQSSGKQVDINTLFQAASLSKAVTALGVAQLVDKENLSLEKPVNDYLKDWKLDGGDSVTISQLLSHSAGVNVPSFPGFEHEEEIPSLLEILQGSPIAKTKPIAVEYDDSQYRYSGGGYQVLEKMIEEVTGETFDNYMESELLKPYGAKNSHFRVMEMSDKENVALGHGYKKNEYEGGWRIYPQAAAAGLWSTPSELAHLLIAYMRAYQGIDGGLISKELAKKMSMPYIGQMGLGFGAHGAGDNLHIDHAGWTNGYRAYMTAFPEKGEAVIVMTNGDAGNRLIEEIMRSAAKQLGWDAYQSTVRDTVRWSEQALADIAGTYAMDPAGFEVSIVVKDNHLQMTTPRGTSHELYPISDSQLVMIEDNTVVELIEGGRLRFWGMTAIKQ